MDVAKKIESISMSKIKMNTMLRFKSTDQLSRRVKTVDNIPKILTIVAGVKKSKQKQVKVDDVINESDEEESKLDSQRKHFQDDLDLSSSSSVDGDNESNLESQINSCQLQDDKNKNGVDELIDKEMIDLLKICSTFKCPSLDELADKYVTFGPKVKGKVLVLDMDETLIHAKFLTTEAHG